MKKTRFRKDIRFFIEMVGMSSTGIGDVTVDDKYALIMVHPSNSIAVTPPVGMELPTFREIVFYTNCLVYEHDLPAFIWPFRKKHWCSQLKEGEKNISMNLIIRVWA